MSAPTAEIKKRSRCARKPCCVSATQRANSIRAKSACVAGSLPVARSSCRSQRAQARSVSGFGRARTCAAWCTRTGPFEASMPPAERRVVDRFGLPAIHLSGSSEQVQRPWVRLPTVKFRNGCGEFRIRRNCVEQSHLRAEFEVVRTAEDFVDGPALDGSNERGTIPEPGSQDAVPKIGDGLVV